MTYKLIKNSLTSVVDQVEYSDSTNRVKIIPFDEANTDYQKYLDRATISSNTSTLVKDSALSIANFIMTKISQILSILSFIISASMLGGGYFGYKYVTSEQFKARMINEVLSNLKPTVPDIIDQKMPNKTSLPIPAPLKTN